MSLTLQTLWPLEKAKQSSSQLYPMQQLKYIFIESNIFILHKWQPYHSRTCYCSPFTCLVGITWTKNQNNAKKLWKGNRNNTKFLVSALCFSKDWKVVLLSVASSSNSLSLHRSIWISSFSEAFLYIIKVIFPETISFDFGCYSLGP